MSEQEQRALALLREILSSDTRMLWDETQWMLHCLFCHQETPVAHDFPWSPQVHSPDISENHEPTCPIRRAMELLKEVDG